MKDNRLLLLEYSGLNSKTAVLVEDGHLILKGLIQKAGVVNGNGRVYSEAILKREDKKYQQLIAENRAAGEMDHPSSAQINLGNISHIITETWWKDNELYGKLKLTSNSVGRDLKDLIEKDGLTLGISTRGLGSISVREGKSFVNEDYSLICYDLVFDPSVAGAYMLHENSNKWVKVDDSALLEGKIVEAKEYNNKIKNKLDNIIDEILSLGSVK